MDRPRSASRRSTVVMILTSVAVVLGTAVGLRSAAVPGGTSVAAETPVPGGTIVPSLRVTAAGDYSASAAAAEVLARIGTLKPDFNIALGDLSYGKAGEEQSWCDLVS